MIAKKSEKSSGKLNVEMWTVDWFKNPKFTPFVCTRRYSGVELLQKKQKCHTFQPEKRELCTSSPSLGIFIYSKSLIREREREPPFAPTCDLVNYANNLSFSVGAPWLQFRGKSNSIPEEGDPLNSVSLCGSFRIQTPELSMGNSEGGSLKCKSVWCSWRWVMQR